MNFTADRKSDEVDSILLPLASNPNEKIQEEKSVNSAAATPVRRSRRTSATSTDSVDSLSPIRRVRKHSKTSKEETIVKEVDTQATPSKKRGRPPKSTTETEGKQLN